MGTAGADRILAIDVGTQSIRAALIDGTGTIHAVVRTPIEPYVSPRPGWAEQRPDYYWERIAESTRRVLAEHPGEALVAVAVTTQRATYVNVDADGVPLRPAIVWLDQRKASAERLIPPVAVPLLKLAGIHDLAQFATQFCRQNWIREHEPAIWDATHKFLGLSGFLTHRLTGLFRDSTGNMLGTMPYDVKHFRWAGPLDPKRRLFHVEPEKLPELAPPGAVLGHVTAAAAAATGIPVGLPVIAASNDKGCEMLGAGCLGPATGCISFGTIATINAATARYVEIERMRPPYPSAIPGQYYTEVGIHRGLWMVSWFKQEFGLPERLVAEREGTPPEVLFDELVRAVPPGSMGLVLQPYWTPGPELDAFAKGAILGFGDVHTRAHVYRAIVEGLAYALKDGAQQTERATGVPITHVRAAGGGSQSAEIMKVTANVFGVPVERPHTHETAVVGAAIDAAVGLGWYGGFEAAVAGMTRVRDVFEPEPRHVAVYRELYERVYRRMYAQLRPLYQEIQRITGYPE